MPVIDVQVHCYERNHPGRPWVGHIAGPDQTDWTRATELPTYEQGVRPFRSSERRSKDDKAKLLGGTHAEVYKWAPSGS